jgi:hypothetical protein
MNQAELTNGGFRDQMINGNITGIRDGISDVQMAIATGFAGVEAGANARTMADMERSFAVQSALQNCCCENRAGLADLKYVVATENCADRAAVESGIRDVITNNTANTQAILDKLCQLELDGVKSELSAANNTIDQLRTQLVLSQEQSSQVAQTSQIVNDIYNRLASCPVGTTPVYGSQPIFTCGGTGCGCGA